MGSSLTPENTGRVCVPLVSCGMKCYSIREHKSTEKCVKVKNLKELLKLNIIRVGDILMVGSETHFWARCVQSYTQTNVGHCMIVSRVVDVKKKNGIEKKIFIAEATESSKAYSEHSKEREWGIIEKEITSRMDEIEKEKDPGAFIFLLRIKERIYQKYIKNENLIYDFFKNNYGKFYDYFGGIQGHVDVKCCGGRIPIFYTNENEKKRYNCSQFVAGCLKHAGILPKDFNIDLVLPNDLVMFNIYEDEYYHFLGTQKNFFLTSKFNTFDVGVWKPKGGLLYDKCFGKEFNEFFHIDSSSMHVFLTCFCFPIVLLPCWVPAVVLSSCWMREYVPNERKEFFKDDFDVKGKKNPKFY